MNRFFNLHKKAASPAVKTAAKAGAAALAGSAATVGLTKLLNATDKAAGELVIDPAISATKGAVGLGIKMALGLIPASALTAAYLASTITSPTAQSENAEDMVINAVERESLAASMRDLEELKRANALSANKLKIHDQFI